MKKKTYLILLLMFASAGMAQVIGEPGEKLPQPIVMERVAEYQYDAAGNRTCRNVLWQNFSDISTNSVQGVESEDVKANSNIWYEGEIGEVKVSVYPNPTTQKVNIQIENYRDDLKGGILYLFTIHGQFLNEFTVSSSKIEVDLSPYPAGTFILKINFKDYTGEWKIIKQ